MSNNLPETTANKTIQFPETRAVETENSPFGNVHFNRETPTATKIFTLPQLDGATQVERIINNGRPVNRGPLNPQILAYRLPEAA